MCVVYHRVPDVRIFVKKEKKIKQTETSKLIFKIFFYYFFSSLSKHPKYHIKMLNELMHKHQPHLSQHFRSIWSQRFIFCYT